jgi:hypothetical protein
VDLTSAPAGFAYGIDDSRPQDVGIDQTGRPAVLQNLAVCSFEVSPVHWVHTRLLSETPTQDLKTQRERV